MHRPTRLLATVAALVSAAGLLAGCSGGSDPAPPPRAGQNSAEAGEGEAVAEPYAGMEAIDIYHAVLKNAKAAKSVHVKAKMPDGKGFIKINMTMNRKGRAFGVTSNAVDGPGKLIRVGKNGYVQPGKKMVGNIAPDEATKKMLTGAWIQFVKGGPSEMGVKLDLTEIDTYLDDVLILSGPDDGLTIVKGKKLAGRETIGLKEKGIPGVVYVAADGSSELVSVRAPDANLLYTQWNKPVRAKAPKTSIPETDLY